MTTTPLLPLAPALAFEDVVRAAEVVARHLPPTPSWSYPVLDRRVGGRVVLKHENVQPTGAFKVRGGVNLAASLSPEEVRRGLVTASTGNHAQSTAYAARLAGTRAVVVMPESAPEVKRDAVAALGAEVVVHGPDLGASAAHARHLAERDGLRWVSPGDDPAIVLGHATLHLELFRSHPDLEVLFVPIGSGTSAAGACLVRDAIAPHCRVVGVQSAAAPAAHRSWSTGALVTADCRTRVAGLATCAGYALPQSVLGGGAARGLDEFVLVSDDEIDAAARVLATDAHTLAEGAGAAALAALLARPAAPAVSAVVVSGGNASLDELAALARG
ncbi:threonine ammonia-lyase [Nocardioides aurantiacus]|uniref:threonine ammonia-lyase n=1 Tax=Nocardioides aurantiacus TaxID=86796 RepID=UPI00403F06B9